MAITFDDEGPVPVSASGKRAASRQSFLEKLLVSKGLMKDPKKAARAAAVTSVVIILLCIGVSVYALAPEPIDEARYYDPITGEPVYSN